MKDVTSINAIDLLEKVNSFYEGAWSNLIVFITIIAVVGVLIPLVIQIYQKRILSLEKESLKDEIHESAKDYINSLFEENLIKLKSEVEQEHSKLEGSIEKKFGDFDSRLTKQNNWLKGGVFSAQASDSLNRGNHVNALYDYLQSAFYMMESGAEADGQRMIDNCMLCMRNIYADDIKLFKEDLGDRYERTIEGIQAANENNRYRDHIRDLKHEWKLCNERVKPGKIEDEL